MRYVVELIMHLKEHSNILILLQIIAIENDPSRASTADPSAVFLNPAIFRKLLPVKVEIDSSVPKVSIPHFQYNH